MKISPLSIHASSYVVSSALDKIMLKLSGAKIDAIVTTMVRLDQGHIYWANWNQTEINRCEPSIGHKISHAVRTMP
jgi:hypothetical protein